MSPLTAARKIDEIIGILTATIERLRTESAAGKGPCMREEEASYD